MKTSIALNHHFLLYSSGNS